MDDLLDYNQDNILVGMPRHKLHGHHSPTTTKKLDVKTDYDDDCPLVPVLVVEETPPMSLPPQFALQAVLETLGSMTTSEESRDDAGIHNETSNAIPPLRTALSSLQGNERRLLLPLVHHYSLEAFLSQGPHALQGTDAQRLDALSQAAGPKWNWAIVRVKRIVSTTSDCEDDDDFESSFQSNVDMSEQDDDDDDEGYADSRLFIDKLVCWTGKRPVDVRWFNLGLHSVQDGGIVLETEEQVEYGDMWTQVESSTGDEVYETFMLAFYDKAIKKNKFSWLKY